MGGSGAKVRRRLERESLSPKRPTKQAPKRLAKRPNAVGSKPTPPPKPKFKKPKHLKRKLESLSNIADNSTDKERLLQELHEFGKIKQQKQTTSAPLSRQKSDLPELEKRNVNKQRIKPGEKTPSALQNPAHVEPVSVSTDSRGDTSKPFFKRVVAPQQSISAPVESTRVVETSVDKEQSKTVSKVKVSPESDDEDDAVSPTTKTRERGKRRRGRAKTVESNAATASETESTTKAAPIDFTEEPTTDRAIASSPTVDGADPDTPKPKRRRDNEDRRCLGRKPVTDFQVGQSYPGKVVYVKPFGVFLDIGCHSDAFCHVSRLSDDFLESPETQFPPGTVIEAARVVEVNRSRKQITVSLQSEARRDDEMASISARQDRRNKHGRITKTSTQSGPFKQDSRKEAVRSPVKAPLVKVSPVMASPPKASSTKPATAEDFGIDPKRARKQARRATRRAEREVTESQ